MTLPVGKKLEWSEADQAKWARKMRWGRWLNSIVGPARERAWNAKLDSLRQAISPYERMEDQERAEVEGYLSEVLDKELRSEYFKTADFDRTLQSLLFNLISSLLTDDRTLTSVLNIGAYFAYVDGRLAKGYPHVSFTALDLVPEMVEFNAENAAPNLKFLSGYALDLLNSGDIRADIVSFSATGAEIKNRELRNYMKVIRGKTEYLVMSEPIYALPGGVICDPASIPLEKSVPAYIQPDSLPHRRGPIAYIHNYRAMLEAAGYQVLHYHARKLSFSELRWVDIIAKPIKLTT